MPYLYVGQLGYYTHYQDQDPEFGLLQLGVRFYDPEVGRFTQRDALSPRAGISRYPYAENTILGKVDPPGQSLMCCNNRRAVPCGDFTNNVLLHAVAHAPIKTDGLTRDVINCVWVCKELKGKTCNQLWALCMHLARKGKKTAAEACLALHHQLCGGR